jgi:hypothetical protein
MTRRPRSTTRVHFTVLAPLREKLELFAKQHGLSMSAVVQDAVMDALSEAERPEVTRAVQHWARRLEQLAQDMVFLTELVGIQFELLMMTLPEVATSDLEAAKRRKDRRHDQTVKVLQHRLRTHTRVWQPTRAAEGDSGAD